MNTDIDDEEKPWPRRVLYRAKDTHVVRAQRFLDKRPWKLGYRDGQWWNGVHTYWLTTSLNDVRHEIRGTNPGNTFGASTITCMVRELRDMCWLDEDPADSFAYEDAGFTDY